MAHISKSPGALTNMDVDFVISYRYANSQTADAASNFEQLIQALASVGLATEVRNGDKHSLLIFLKVASERALLGEVYRSRVNDWLHGVRSAAPDKETQHSLGVDPLYEAERLRIIYQLITNPVSEGGAGITPKEGNWKSVESAFALHDHAHNKEWMKKWATTYVLKTEELDDLRNRLGEKIAFYFAFTQAYFVGLIGLSAFAFSAWVLFGYFSSVYAIVNCLWCIIFVEYWRHQETDLAIRWGVRGVSSISTKRTDFKSEQTTVDPVTGEQVQIFPAIKRLQWQSLQVPFALAAAVVLGSLIAVCFGIEIFISEIYNGPFKSILVFLPTGILTTGMPVLKGFLSNIATQLNELENYETEAAYETAMTHKLFVLDVVTSYFPLFLTAFVYVPFGSLIVPYLDIFKLTVRPFAENEQQMKAPKSSQFSINPSRLRKQVFYFAVTAQTVNLAIEVIVPYLKQQGFSKYKQIQSERAAKRDGSDADLSEHDPPEEKAFLKRVRQEAELDVYDVNVDLREMVVQFGYLSLFSVVWPLTAVSFLINNWLEIRTDAVKIAVEMQRPMPLRADTIGAWLDSLSFLTWLGSMTTAALVYLFSNDGMGPDGTPYDIKGWVLVLCIFFSEQLHLLVRAAVRVVFSKIDSPGKQKERRERYEVRKRYLEESLGEQARQMAGLDGPMGMDTEKLSRASLEEEARRLSASTRVEDRFWSRQVGWRETATIGKHLIERVKGGEAKKVR